MFRLLLRLNLNLLFYLKIPKLAPMELAMLLTQVRLRLFNSTWYRARNITKQLHGDLFPHEKGCVYNTLIIYVCLSKIRIL